MSKQSPRQIAEQKQLAVLIQVEEKLATTRKEIKAIDDKMQKLKDKRAKLASERDRLIKIKAEPPTFERRGGTGQGLYVHTRYFIDVVKEWIDDYDAENGKGGRFALQILSGVAGKTIRSYINGTITYAGIYSVDRILTGIGREDLLNDLPWKTTTELKIGSNIPKEPPHSQFYEE